MHKFIAFTLLLPALSIALVDAPITQPAAPPFDAGKTAAATQPTTRPFDQEAAARLIRQFGDEDFAVREAATKKLIDLGEGVWPMLVEKTKEHGLDPEVADRIQRVIDVLDRQHWHVFKGTVVDPQGKPVANAKVRPYAGGQDFAAEEVRTKADGTFVLRLRPGVDCQQIAAASEDETFYVIVEIPQGPHKPKPDATVDLGIMKLAPSVWQDPF